MVDKCRDCAPPRVESRRRQTSEPSCPSERSGALHILGVVALLASCSGSSTPSVDFRAPRFDVRVEEAIVYATAATADGDADLHLDLYQPVGEGRPERPPGLLLVHGGGFRTGSRRQVELVRIATEMAKRGYVTASIDYRLLSPRPLIAAEIEPFLEYIGGIDFAAAAVADTFSAYRWMLANTNVDPDRIIVGGGSAGAIASAHLAYSFDDAGQADRPDFVAVLLLWGELLFTSARDLESGEPPFFVVHGDRDTMVLFSEATELVARAEQVGVAFEFAPIAGAGHGFVEIDLFEREVEPGVTVFDRMVEFCATRATREIP